MKKSKLRLIIKEEISKLKEEKVPSKKDFGDIASRIMNQALWRSKEWGDKLFSGQFKYYDVPFNGKNIKDFFNYIRSSAGKKVVQKVLNSDKPNYEASTVEDFYDNDDMGLFGADAYKEELQFSKKFK